MSKQRYYLSVENLSKARGPVSELSYQGNSPDSLATTLQAALREPTLWQRWRSMQPDPDAVDQLIPGISLQPTEEDIHRYYKHHGRVNSIVLRLLPKIQQKDRNWRQLRI